MGYMRVSSSRSSAQMLTYGTAFFRTLFSLVTALFSALSNNGMCLPHSSCDGRFYAGGQASCFVHIPVHLISKSFKGGNTLLPGFLERLQVEIQGLLAPNTGDNLHISNPKNRDFSVWCGGAMLANLETFNSAWISLEEYMEHGPQIVHRKCF